MHFRKIPPPVHRLHWFENNLFLPFSFCVLKRVHFNISFEIYQFHKFFSFMTGFNILCKPLLWRRQANFIYTMKVCKIQIWDTYCIGRNGRKELAVQSSFAHNWPNDELADNHSFRCSNRMSGVITITNIKTPYFIIISKQNNHDRQNGC